MGGAESALRPLIFSFQGMPEAVLFSFDSLFLNRFTKPVYSSVMLKRRKATTIRDVAVAARLSPTAVSRYLNRSMALPDESASRIDEAIRKLNYQPNGLAPYTADFGREVANELLTSKKSPTAIFAASDYVALGVLNAAKNLHMSIPQDLSLLGFDDMPFAALLSPPLTTIRQPIRELGEAGAISCSS